MKLTKTDERLLHRAVGEGIDARFDLIHSHQVVTLRPAVRRRLRQELTQLQRLYRKLTGSDYMEGG